MKSIEVIIHTAAQLNRILATRLWLVDIDRNAKYISKKLTLIVVSQQSHSHR